MQDERKDLTDVVKQALAQKELTALVDCNRQSGQYGLTLTKEEALMLMDSRNESLKRERRLELGEGILKRLIDVFCDSAYLTQENYLESLERLQDIFYEFKNESMDLLTDEELLAFMKEQFEEVCMGDFDYLEGTCLERFTRAIRAGYKGYEKSGGYREYGQFDEEQRWDKELYLTALENLM